MIESGLGLCAACLPVQYGLKSSKGIQTILQSLQSAISLRSLVPRKDTEQATKLSSATSKEYFAASAEAPARDDQTLELGPMPQDNEIIVTHSLEQTHAVHKE